MQAAACKQASIASERDDARSACGWWIGRCRGQHQRMLSDSSEFVIVDFSAGVLQVSMMVVTVGYAVFGVDTLYGLGMNSNLTEEYKLLTRDPVYKWASTRWPTFVQVCLYEIDKLVPTYGDDTVVMPLGKAGSPS